MLFILCAYPYINATFRKTAARSDIRGTFVLMASVREHYHLLTFYVLKKKKKKKTESADSTLILTCNCLSDCSKIIYVPVSSHGHVMTSKMFSLKYNQVERAIIRRLRNQKKFPLQKPHGENWVSSFSL